jgi:hypothetical protein
MPWPNPDPHLHDQDSNWQDATHLTQRDQLVADLVREFTIRYLEHWAREPRPDEVYQYLVGAESVLRKA